MTKLEHIHGQAYSKAAKRRRKRARITLAGGVSVMQAVGQGRRTDIDNAPPPIFWARAQRCNLEGKSVLHESDMGRCILALTEGQERADLAQVWADLSAARRNYRMRVIGQTGEPKGAATPMLTEAMETDPSLRVDLRSPDERDQAARNRWHDWQSKLAALPAPQMRWAIRGALDGFLGEAALWKDGQPTANGRIAVSAIKLLT